MISIRLPHPMGLNGSSIQHWLAISLLYRVWSEQWSDNDQYNQKILNRLCSSCWPWSLTHILSIPLFRHRILVILPFMSTVKVKYIINSSRKGHNKTEGPYLVSSVHWSFGSGSKNKDRWICWQIGWLWKSEEGSFVTVCHCWLWRIHGSRARNLQHALCSTKYKYKYKRSKIQKCRITNTKIQNE